MNITERIKGLLLKPKEEWQTIAGETTPIAELYKNYIFVLAAIGPVASFIGMSLMGVSLPMGGSYRVSITSGIISAGAPGSTRRVMNSGPPPSLSSSATVT